MKVTLDVRDVLWTDLLHCYRTEEEAKRALQACLQVAVINASTVHVAARLPPGTVTFGSTPIRPPVHDPEAFIVTETEMPMDDPWVASWD